MSGSAISGDCRNTVAVLVVEANRGDAARIRTSLAELGAGTAVRPWFHVSVVFRHADALAVLKLATRAGPAGSAAGDEAPAVPVVLLDLDLPDARGIDALRELHAAVPEVAIIVLTRHDDDELAMEALAEGAQDYLVRGRADGDAMARAIRHAIARKRAEVLMARTQWLAGIGETAIAIRHEVNNPLQALMLNAELLQGAPEGDRRELEQSVLDSARRIAVVLRRLERVQEPRSVSYVGGERMIDLGPAGERASVDPGGRVRAVVGHATVGGEAAARCRPARTLE